ncbi:MAG: hypothetical protein IJZ45_09750 [Bacteroidaceae bacterium]|nr:hypothetical protein [Bacteroidaceae bacterium]
MSFTDRMGIEIPEPKITIRNEAPVGLRLYLLQIMLRYANLKKIRSYVCWVTKEAEDPNNWAENDYMKSEVQTILEYCSWYRIYDIIEYFYNMLENTKSEFEKDINEYFIEKGIGWKLCNGIIETRGDKAFEQKIAEVIDVLGDVGLETSQNEIREALKDMSKRPEPDITGSVQHSVASLECLCREITGDKKLTLGTLIKQNSEIVPKPLDNVIKEVFGFASEHGRHVREGDIPTYEDAELIVHLCASLCCYLSKKNFERNGFKDWL